MKPKVSILCLTYNHANFIKQTLDGFLTQETNFPIEIVVHDDASTDGTREILQEYAKKYPKIIYPIYEEKNQYSLNNFKFINDMYSNARGKYIATCEGDDYWIEPNKLQLQVDFLEKNREYAFCFHPVKVVYEHGGTADAIFPDKRPELTTKGLLRRNFIQTNSVVYRKQKYENINLQAIPGDWYMHLYHAQFGKIGYINKVMAVYRRHPGGVWWQSSSAGSMDEIWKKYGVGHLILYTELLKMYGGKEEYVEIIDELICNAVRIMGRIDATSKTQLIHSFVDSGMGGGLALLSLSRSVRRIADLHDKTLSDFDQYYSQLQKHNDMLQLQFDSIVNSSSWKITRPLRVFIRILKRRHK